MAKKEKEMKKEVQTVEVNKENVLKNSYDVVFYLEAKHGNVNGDPNREGAPRIDIHTGKGIVTDVCMKRRIRDYVDLAHGDEAGCALYIKNDASLNKKDLDVCKQLGFADCEKAIKENAESALAMMVNTYFDIRCFGAVMTSFSKGGAPSAGRLTGPVQFDIGESLEPVEFEELKLTRVAVTTDKDAESKDNTFGTKFYVPFAVYKIRMHISGALAEKNGMSEKDLQYILDAIKMHTEESRSAMRGTVAGKDVFVFKHNGKMRGCRFSEIDDCIIEEKMTDGVAEKYEDYKITVDTEKLPKSVQFYQY